MIGAANEPNRPHAATGVHWLVPLYPNPCCVDGPAMWSAIQSLAQSHPQQLAVIVNPASGPGASPIDPNFVNASGTGPAVALLGTSAIVIGYISTSYGNRDIDAVRTEISRYYSSAYWRGLPLRLDGIFFDEMSPDLGNVGYYQALGNHVRQIDASALLIGNPGQPFVSNPSGQSVFSAADFGSVFDVLVVSEGNETSVSTHYTAPPWLGAAGAAQLGFIAHSSASPVRHRIAMSRMLARDGRWLYVTDDVLPNPFDRLPGYWSTQVPLLQELLFVDSFD